MNTQIDYEFLSFMRFYQVDTERQLIRAQAEHIEKLQARLAKSEYQRIEAVARVPREG